MHKRGWISIFYLLPAILTMLTFVFYPIARNVGYSLAKWNLISGTAQWVGLGNYIALFRSSDFAQAFLNNVRYVIISLIFQVGVALIFAAMLENMKYRRLSAVYRTTFFLPSLISLTIIGLMFTFIYNNQGLLNNFMQLVGLGAYTTGWLGNGKTAIYAVIAVSQWRNIGYTMILLIVAIQRIPREIIEGGSHRWRLRYVYLYGYHHAQHPRHAPDRVDDQHRRRLSGVQRDLYHDLRRTVWLQRGVEHPDVFLRFHLRQGGICRRDCQCDLDHFSPVLAPPGIHSAQE